MSHSSLSTCSGKLLPCPQGQVSPKAIKRPCPAQASSVFLMGPAETEPGGCLEAMPWGAARMRPSPSSTSLSPSLGAFPSLHRASYSGALSLPPQGPREAAGGIKGRGLARG